MDHDRAKQPGGDRGSAEQRKTSEETPSIMTATPSFTLAA